MAEQKHIKEFPELSNKLSAPTKKSLFERQRAEAEVKRVREEAETAAVLNDFVKSFDDDDGEESREDMGSSTRPRFGNTVDDRPRAPAGPPRRHFTSTGRTSGPGSLGPPPNLSRNRPFDGPSRPDDRRRERGLFAYDDSESSVSKAFRASEEEDNQKQGINEEERAAPKPTMQLSCLPPGTSPAVIKSLIPDLLRVEGVRVVTPAGPGRGGSTERKSMSAIVTLASETPANDIDSVVTSLQNKYLGWGFNLSISRHLSSAALGSMNNAPSVNLNSYSSSLPFNAQPVQEAPPVGINRVVHSMHRGGIAPPSSYAPHQQSKRAASQIEVKVSPLSDIKQLQLIHKTLEALITHGPEFEALLMSRPEVQKDEKWSWIWNPRSPGGIWYRWRLWEVLTGAGGASKKERGQFKGGNTHSIFDGAFMWTESDDLLPFEFTTKFEDLVSDSDYNSSDEDESGEEDGPRKRRRQFGAYAGKGAPPEGILTTPADEQTFLNPLQKAKFTHLLARLPTSTAKLRKGDVARVTAFAISHAGRGAEEVVQILVSNVVQPYAYSRNANPERERESAADSDGVDYKEEPLGLGKKDTIPVKEDTSPSKLVALCCISDILSASSTAGVRHSWRYRALIESALKRRKIFTHLGKVEKMAGWGRLRAEKWRRSVTGVLERWEQWCVFSAETHASFVQELEDAVKKEEEELKKKEETEKVLTKGKSKWKAVDVNASLKETESGVDAIPVEPMDLDVKVKTTPGRSTTDLPKSGPTEDQEVRGHTRVEKTATNDQARDLKGGGPPAFVVSPPSKEPVALPAAPVSQVDTPSQMPLPTSSYNTKRRQRPKAEDMFADSDDE